ncbi:MAG TPA: hypothetical protein VFV19_16220 [Candidatus Polarisedimenticolaceae bacterium]|nr:hypothetical protein [Candidatus Polarisedimenticolaceae bacterium]
MTRVAGVLVHLEAQGVPAALIGGAALAAHGIARSTVDVDLYTADARVLDPSFWAAFDPPEIRRGDALDPLAGVVRWNATEPVDLIVGRGSLAAEIVARRQWIESDGAKLPLVEAADLILLKLVAGGPQDLLDVRLLLQADPDGWRSKVEERLSKLPREARDAWSRIATA